MAGNQIKQRGFTGAVGTDQPMHRSRSDSHRNVADRDKTAETTRKPTDFQQCGHYSLTAPGFRKTGHNRGDEKRLKRSTRMPLRPRLPVPASTITMTPKRRSRNSPDARSRSGITTTMAAPSAAPGKLLMPPITTMIRISMDFWKSKSLGLR